MVKEILFPKETILITKYFDIHQDWEVPIPGFFIIASIRKVKSMADFNEEEARDFFKLLYKLRKGMRDILGIKEVYLFQREDSGHGFHLWVFPRCNWMIKFGKKSESIRPIITYAKENMKTEKVSKEIKDMVEKIKDYMTET